MKRPFVDKRPFGPVANFSQGSRPKTLQTEEGTPVLETTVERGDNLQPTELEIAKAYAGMRGPNVNVDAISLDTPNTAPDTIVVIGEPVLVGQRITQESMKGISEDIERQLDVEVLEIAVDIGPPSGGQFL